MSYMIVVVLSILLTTSGGTLAQSSPGALTPQASAAPSTSERAAKHGTPTAALQPQAVVEKKKEGEISENEAEKVPHQPELAVLGKNNGTEPINFQYKMGEILQIRATGGQAKKLKTGAMAVLYFDGVRMANLTSTPIEAEAGKDLLLLNFHLVRDSTTDEDRKAWGTFFKSKNEHLMTVRLAIAAGNDLPAAVHSLHPVRFIVADNRYIWGILTAGIVILFVSYYRIVKHTRMLQDADSNLYSLGKSQMVFWGLLVLLAFIGVWLLNGTMERIPPQALLLLGMSAATGLGAVVIGNSQSSAIQTAIDELRIKEQLLSVKLKSTEKDAFPLELPVTGATQRQYRRD